MEVVLLYSPFEGKDQVRRVVGMSCCHFWEVVLKGAVSTILLMNVAGCLERSVVGEQATSDSIGFASEPEARAIYDRMIAAVGDADSLSLVSKFECESVGKTKDACTYKLWLKKPNYFRMETESSSGEQGGILIGDGDDLWIYWPNGRPSWENIEESPADEETRFTSYMTKPTPQGRHSIAHEAIFLGGGIVFPIWDASTFHGYVDSLQEYIDGMRNIGMESIEGERCDIIEVSLLNRQRSWYLWLSKRDHLPRKLKEIVRLSNKIITKEEWSFVKVDEDIPPHLFEWQPPADWHQWKLPDDEADLPKPGEKAVDFDLASVDGGRIKLSDFQGKTVWLCFWRLGCPPCRVETPYIQQLYTTYKDQDLVVLGVNVSDDKEITLEYLNDRGVTFPNILDSSEDAQKVASEGYHVGTIPMNCLIDGDGIVIDAWSGHSEERARAALKNAGIELIGSAP